MIQVKTATKPKSTPDVPYPNAPMEVRVNIPFDLVRMAMEYPTLDWNDIMRTAVNGTPPQGERQ